MNINKDLNYALQLSRQCLRLIGVWPDPHISLSDFHRPRIRFIIAICAVSFYIFTPQAINLIRAWGNVNRMMECFVAANFSMMAICKLVVTKYHGEKLRTLIASIMTDWMTSNNNSERNKILKLGKNSKNLSFRYFIATIGTTILAVYVRLEGVFRNIRKPRRYLPYRFDYIQKTPSYEITCFIQICGGIYTIFGNYSVDNFISILILHICAQLINLQTTLNNLVDKLNDNPVSSSKFRKGLIAIIIRHEHLIRSAKTIDDCYSIVLFVHMVGASFQICLITFQIFTMITDNLDFSPIRTIYLIFFISLVLMQLYIYCYASERLLTENINMAYTAYDCKWYNILAKDARDLMFIVYRSMIPLKLSAGIFGNFSLELFGIAIKTSMGYLSALLTIRE